MAPKDPVDRATTGDSIYEVTDWEPRSALDRIAVQVHELAVAGSKATVVVSGLAITLAIVGVTGIDLVADPQIGTMVALSALPAVALAAYLWHVDVTTEEPATLLVATFVLAVLFAGFAALINTYARARMGLVVASVGNLLAFGAYYFLVVGPVEEGVKLLAVRLLAYTDHRFDAVIDGAVYGAVAGLGFATIENALYITDVIVAAGGVASTTQAQIEGITTVRALAGPGHVLYSAIAGYYLGLAKFNPDRAGPIVVKGLLVASAFHATYNVSVGPGIALVSGVTPFAGLSAFVVYVLLYQGAVGYYLYRKLDRYRRAYHDRDAGSQPAPAEAELAEFDP